MSECGVAGLFCSGRHRMTRSRVGLVALVIGSLGSALAKVSPLRFAAVEKWGACAGLRWV
jgi:hypothetical protein